MEKAKAGVAPELEQLDQFHAERFSISVPPDEIRETRTAWKKKVEGALGEMERLETARREHRPMRRHALGKIMLVELDKKVGFSASQRERLLPIAEHLVDVPAFFPEDMLDSRDATLRPSAFFLAGANAPWKEMMEILDDAQWKRWKKACDSKTIEEEAWRRSEEVRTEAVDDGKYPLVPSEPEVLETAVSDFLHTETAPARKRLLHTMMFRVEDVARLAELGPESVNRLQIAAKGATEASLARWKEMVDPIAHDEMGDVSPANVRHRLFSIRRFIFERSPDIQPENQPVWKKAVLDELTDAQQVKLQKELNGRNTFKISSIASLILAEFDRRVPISKAQRDTLEPIISKLEIEYAPDLEMLFREQWYYQELAIFIPLAGVPEPELAAILSKEQLDGWNESQGFASTEKNWRIIQESHAHRANYTAP